MTLRIRELRQQKGWSIEHLAELAGMSRSHLNQIELGYKVPNTRRLEQLAEALGVEVSDLFTVSRKDADRELVELFNRLPREEQEVWLQLLRTAVRRVDSDEGTGPSSPGR